MNIYLLTQEEARGFDTYDAMIVFAETEDEARLMHPDNCEYNPNEKYPSWARSPEMVEVKLIGVATEAVESGIVLASFNAG